MPIGAADGYGFCCIKKTTRAAGGSKEAFADEQSLRLALLGTSLYTREAKSSCCRICDCSANLQMSDFSEGFQPCQYHALIGLCKPPA